MWEKDLTAMAGEMVKVEDYNGTIYAYCDNEIGVLRIFYQYRDAPKNQCRVFWSKNLNKWVFAKELIYSINDN